MDAPRDPPSYHDLLSGFPFGKRLPEAVYVHASGISQLPRECWTLVAAAQRIAEVTDDRFNVVKFARAEHQVSLLAYPRFFEDGFPILDRSWTAQLDQRTCTYRAYSAEENPPILHRKELLLPAEHPAVPDFAALTRRVSEYGLLENAHEIGFLLPWQARLDRLGLIIRGNEVVERDERREDEPVETLIQRERTALSRYALSSPMQALWRHGYFDGQRSVFDYGCGRGDDVRILGALGIEATGWDPHFRANAERTPADLVNLGFVLNVIEDRRERADALQSAWALSRRLLVVAALVGNGSQYEKHRLYRDGVITARGTFQKYFSQVELRDYIEAVLEQPPRAVGPGIFFVFRDDDDEQAFLESRDGRRSFRGSSVPYDSPPRSRPDRLPRTSRWTQHRELLDEFWARCLQLGRMAEVDEFDRAQELTSVLGSHKRAFGYLLRENGSAELESARRRRREDLSVILALELFERRGRGRGFSPRAQRDIRSIWGSVANALVDAKRVLFESGDREHLMADATVAISANLGNLDSRGHLNVHASVVRRLPTRLRVFVGCAERIYGDVSGCDLVRLHLGSKKLSLLAFERFMDEPVPRLRRRVKILLARADFLEFDYPPDRDAPLLFWKSDYLPDTFPDFERQKGFDEQLRALRWHETENWPLSAESFRAQLERAGLRVRSHQIVRSRARRPPEAADALNAVPQDATSTREPNACVLARTASDTRRDTAVTAAQRMNETMTIIEATSTVLRNSSTPLTAREIHDQIIVKGLFSFGAKDPVGIVRAAIRKHLRANEDKRPGLAQVARDQFTWRDS